MNRRVFIGLAAAGAASLYLPAGCTARYTLTNKALAQPQFLAHICDAKALRQIGAAYKRAVPAENADRTLAQLLLKDAAGHRISEATETDKLQALLQQNVQQDFEKAHTVLVDGWVLSQTEARQCALFLSQG